MQQARLAGSPVHRWRYGCAPAAGATAPAAVNTVAGAPPAAQVESNGARPEPVQAPARGTGAAAADETEPPKPVPPTLTPEQREAGRLKALEITAQRKELREQLQAGTLTLAQALARDDEAARGLRTQTLLRALPGIGGATAARLRREAGIDAGRRAGALTAGQHGRLVAAVAVVDAELAARRDRRHHSGQ